MYEIVPPLDEEGNYVINDNQPFGPSSPIWSYSGGFHSPMQSGAFRLPNGNTIVTSAQFGYVFEVEMIPALPSDDSYGLGQRIRNRGAFMGINIHYEYARSISRHETNI